MKLPRVLACFLGATAGWNPSEPFYQKYTLYVWGALLVFTTLMILVVSLASLLRRSRRLEAELRQHRKELEAQVAERTAALSSSEARYRRLFEDAPIALWEEDFSATKAYLEELKIQGVTDFKKFFTEHPDQIGYCMGLMEVLDVNWATLQLYNAPDKQTLYENISKTFDPNSLSATIAALVSLAEGNPIFEIETVARKLTGESMSLLLRSFASPVDQEMFARILVAMVDMTERERAKAALRESESLLNSFGEIARIGGWELDAETRTVRWTRGTYHIHEIPEGESVPLEEAANFYHPEDRPRLLEALHNALHHGEAFDSELRFITAKGKQLWVRAIGRPIFEHSRIVRLIGVFQDITPHRQAEEALRASEEKYRLLAENMDDVVWTLDLQGQFTYVSPSVERLRGYTPEEVMRQPMDEALTPDSLEIAVTNLRTVYELAMSGSRDPYRRRYELKQPCKDGSIVWTEAVTSVMYDENGQFIGVLGVTRDITARKQADDALKQAKEQAENVERMKSTFFANVSHHLRTPLNAILGFAELMAEAPARPASDQEYLALIRQNGKDLLALINQMLNISKLEPQAIAADHSSRQVLALLEAQTPQAAPPPETTFQQSDIEAKTLQENIRALPDELRRDLLDATHKFDILRMQRIIEQIRSYQPQTAEMLMTCTKNFDYERIMNLFAY